MIAYLFPGQGVQQKNMLSLLEDRSPNVEEIFEIASDATGRDVKALCASEDTELLSRTENAQIALTAVNCALERALFNRGIRADIAAGHSLGQYSALMTMGVLSLHDGFSLIKKRAELMGSVRKKGLLCAVIGSDEKTVRDVCASTGCEIALLNAPGQIVIGGEENNVRKAAFLTEKAGALKTEILSVSNAFHTSVMKEIEEEYASCVNAVTLKEPSGTVLLNCKGGPATDVEEIRKDLIAQTCHTVLWADCMKYLVVQTPECVYEVGIGKVLTGLLKKQNRKIVFKNVFMEG